MPFGPQTSSATGESGGWSDLNVDEPWAMPYREAATAAIHRTDRERQRGKKRAGKKRCRKRDTERSERDIEREKYRYTQRERERSERDTERAEKEREHHRKRNTEIGKTE